MVKSRLTLFILVLTLASSFAWLSGWNYRREITITEQSGASLTNYQVLIELNSSNFDFSKANNDGSDIRFTDTSDNLLDYWIENWNVTSQTAKIWVKVNLTANANTTIYLYYGNDVAESESNWDSVFPHIRDILTFTEDKKVKSLKDGTEWSPTCGGNGNLIVHKIEYGIIALEQQDISTTDYCYYNLGDRYDFTKLLSIEFSFYLKDYQIYTGYDAVISKRSDTEQAGAYVLAPKTNSTTTRHSFYVYSGSGVLQKAYIYKQYTTPKWVRLKYVYNEDTDTFKVYENNVLIGSNTDITNTLENTTHSFKLFHDGQGSEYSKGTLGFIVIGDDISETPSILYADPEPTSIIGDEEIASNFSFTYSPTDPHVEEPILFNITSAENMTEFWWDFGDGNITHTTETTIYHIYYLGGNYLVNLTGYNNYTRENESTWTTVTVFEPTIYIYARNNQTGTLLSNFTVRVWNSTTEETFTSNGTVASWSYHEGPKGNISLLVLKDYYNSTVKNLYISNSSDLNYTDDLIPAVMIFRVLSSDYNIPIPGKITLQNITQEYTKECTWDHDVYESETGTSVAISLTSNKGQIFYIHAYADAVGDSQSVEISADLCDEDGNNCINLFDETETTAALSRYYYVFVSKQGTYKMLDTTANIVKEGTVSYFPATIKISATESGTLSGTATAWVKRPSDLVIYATDPEYLTGNVTTIFEQNTEGFFGYLTDTYESNKFAFVGITSTSLINLTAYLIPSNKKIVQNVYVLSPENTAIDGALISVYTFIDGEYQLVTSSFTDSTGKAEFNLEQNKQYVLVISKTGYTTETANIVATGDTLYFQLSPSIEQWANPFSGIALDVEPETVYAGENTTFRLIVSDPSGLLESYYLTIYRNNISLANLSGTSTTGGILEYTVNIGVDETGFYKIVYGFTRNYEGNEYTFNSSRLFPVVVHGMMEQAEDLMKSGTFGDFGKAFISLAVITVAFSHGTVTGVLASIVLMLLGAVPKSLALIIILAGISILLMGVSTI